MGLVRAEGILGLSYSLVAHVCVLTDRVTVAMYWFAALLVLFALNLARRRNAKGLWGVLLLVVAVAVALSAAAGQEAMVFLPPVAINLLLFLTFVGSLQAGETPLITRLALLMDPGLSDLAVRYTRSVTIVWAGYFLLMTILVSCLAVFAPIQVWSYGANCLQYLLVPAIFVGEFLVRRRALGPEADADVRSFVKRLLATVG